MLTMNVTELHKELTEIIAEGNGHCPIGNVGLAGKFEEADAVTCDVDKDLQPTNYMIHSSPPEEEKRK